MKGGGDGGEVGGGGVGGDGGALVRGGGGAGEDDVVAEAGAFERGESAEQCAENEDRGEEGWVTGGAASGGVWDGRSRRRGGVRGAGAGDVSVQAYCDGGDGRVHECGAGVGDAGAGVTAGGVCAGADDRCAGGEVGDGSAGAAGQD